MPDKRADGRARFLRGFATFCFVVSAVALVFAWRVHLWSAAFSGVGIACAGLAAVITLRHESPR